MRFLHSFPNQQIIGTETDTHVDHVDVVVDRPLQAHQQVCQLAAAIVVEDLNSIKFAELGQPVVPSSDSTRHVGTVAEVVHRNTLA